ncbi:MAG: hypothetical protein IPM08_00935 [Actinomycetales bacterium]|nr:hypothetical protein [Actinomycetales bacterium]
MTKVVVGAADFSSGRCSPRSTPRRCRPKGISASGPTTSAPARVYLKAVEDGSVDMVPEYTGSLLSYLDKAAAKASEEVYAALGKALPAGLTVLAKSNAGQKLHRRDQGDGRRLVAQGDRRPRRASG